MYFSKFLPQKRKTCFSKPYRFLTDRCSHFVEVLQVPCFTHISEGSEAPLCNIQLPGIKRELAQSLPHGLSLTGHFQSLKESDGSGKESHCGDFGMNCKQLISHSCKKSECVNRLVWFSFLFKNISPVPECNTG